jgi:hypothetical protein
MKIFEKHPDDKPHDLSILEQAFEEVYKPKEPKSSQMKKVEPQ